MSTKEKVRCTYTACNLLFDSNDEMQSHKASADKHHYCMKCDMDFMNQALLHLHKVMSEHHFACLECELELRSEAGLRYHVKMSHPQGKEVVCMGCGRKYKSASAVMKHIEEQECPVLALPDRPSRDDECELLDAETIMAIAKVSPKLHASGDVSEDEDEGGVLLDVSTEQETRSEDTPGPGIMLSDAEWPVLGSKKPDIVSTEMGGDLAFDMTGSLLDQAIPMELRVTPDPRRTQTVLHDMTLAEREERSFLAGLSSSRPNAHGNSTTINPEDFWNEKRRRYICNCNASFLHVATFMHHIAEEDDAVIDCPRCGKRFSTHAAQVAHVEAPFSKCAARVTTAEIERELSAITEGFAEIKGNDQKALDDMEYDLGGSQGSNDATASSSEDTLEDALESSSEVIVDAQSVQAQPANGEIPGDTLEYDVEDLADDSVEDALAQDLGGLVFSKKEGDQKGKGRQM